MNLKVSSFLPQLESILKAMTPFLCSFRWYLSKSRWTSQFNFWAWRKVEKVMTKCSSIHYILVFHQTTHVSSTSSLLNDFSIYTMYTPTFNYCTQFFAFPHSRAYICLFTNAFIYTCISTVHLFCRVPLFEAISVILDCEHIRWIQCPIDNQH